MTEQHQPGEPLAVLIVEDEPNAANPVKAALEAALGAQVKVITDFEAGLHELRVTRNLDVLVLDLYLGSIYEPPYLEGAKLWTSIWEERFVPIAIHTAAPDVELSPAMPSDNPFIRAFTKGAGSPAAIVQYVAGLAPFIHQIKQVTTSIEKATSVALRDSSTAIWRSTAGVEQIRSPLLIASVRRRVAALMDEGVSGQAVQAWEQYVYPPIAASLMTGDLLKATGTNADEPTAYRLVLSPSCDLQVRDGQCDLTHVLVSRCVSINDFLKSAPSLSKLAMAKLKDRLPGMLTQPHIDRHVILPAFGDIFPDLAADLRSLELLPLAEISVFEGEDKTWTRVASIDSPFRELLTWAYLLVAGRPGVPDRDFAALLQAIADAPAEPKQASID